MHIVSVVTLLLGSIFAYTVAAPQFGGGGYYPVNIAALSTALSQLAQQLAAQRNNTITIGNSSTIVSGVSSSVANAHIDGDGNRRPGHHHSHQHNGGWNNGGWNNGGWGYWRGVPEQYEMEDGNETPEEAHQEEDETEDKE